MLGNQELLFALNELKNIIVVTDVNGIITYVNKSFSEIYGYTEDDVVGQNVNILNSGFHSEDFYKDLWDTILSGQTWEGNFRNKKKNGSIIWESAKITPIERNGTLIGFIAIKDDISAKKEMEELLYKEKFLLDELFDNTPVGIIIFKPTYENNQLKDLIVMKANPIASEIFGKLGIVGLPLRKFLPNYKSLYQKTDDFLSTKQTFEYFCTGINKHLKLRSFPLENTSFCIVFNDVTEYRNTINALEESEQRYYSLVEDSPALIRRFNKEGIISYVNNYYAEYYNKKQADFIGKSLFTILKEENLENFRKNLDSITISNPIIEYQQQNKFKDGSIRWQRWTDRALIDSKGNIAEYQSVGMDFTRLKTIEIQLEEERNKLRAIFDNSLMGISVFNKKGETLLENSKLTDLFKNNLFPSTSNYFNTVSKEDLPIAKQNFERIFSGKIKTFNTKRKYKKKDGSFFWAEIFATPITYKNGKPSEALAMIIDITDRYQMEQELVASEQKLKKINNTKDKLFSIIAHDIKNPFNAIIGFSTILDMNYQSFSESEIRDFISRIVEASEQTYKLLEDLLTWAKSQLGQLKVNKVSISTENILTECVESLHTLVKNKNIEVKVSIHYNDPIYADSNMLQFVIRNLIHNALKFSFPNSTIECSVFEKDKDHISITVKDYGIGIKEEKLKILFNLEEFLSTTGTSEEKGSGLGLSLSKEMIELNHGTIEVCSTTNKGSLFIINLPKC